MDCVCVFLIRRITLNIEVLEDSYGCSSWQESVDRKCSITTVRSSTPVWTCFEGKVKLLFTMIGRQHSRS